MRAIFQKWLVSAVISFVIRQLEQFGEDTDWDTVAGDLDKRVRDLIPGSWFDDKAAALCNSLLKACEEGLKHPKTVGSILDLLAEGKHSEAAERLKMYLMKAWKPADEKDQYARSLLENVKYV